MIRYLYSRFLFLCFIVSLLNNRSTIQHKHHNYSYQYHSAGWLCSVSWAFLLCFCYIADPATNTSITTTPSNTTVLRGSTVSLNCSTDANPDANVYQLYLKNDYIGNSSSGVFNVTVDKDGVYTCVPINEVGSGHNTTVSMTTVGESRNKTILLNESNSCMQNFLWLKHISYFLSSDQLIAMT